MNQLHIDLAPFSPMRELHRIPPVARWAAMVGLLLCIVAGFRMSQLLGRVASLDRETTHLAARAAANARRSKAGMRVSIDEKQGEAVNAAVARLNLPWADILNAIETATPQQVSLLSIRPEPGRGRLTIEAQTNGSDDMIRYLKALELQPLIGRVDLTKHERVRDGFAEVMRFRIEVQWRSAVF